MKAGSKNGTAAPPGAAGSPETGAVLFPGPEGWELWSGTAAQPVCEGPVGQPAQLRPSPGCVMSLPARSFFSLPIWVPVVEDSPTREQTQMRLEMKGMLGANPDAAIWNFETLRREELPPLEDGQPLFRQLESTAVLAAPFPAEWLVENATRYEPSGRMLPAPESGAVGVLRRELGRWVADFYWGGKWLHTQPLLAASLDATAAVELAATQAQLDAEGILPRLEGWRIRENGVIPTPDFSRILGIPVRVEERVAPRSPTERWNLPPPALTELRTERQQAARRKSYLRGGMTIYGVLFMAGIAFFAWPLVRLKLTQAELKKIGPEAESIRATAMVWREAGAWLEPRRNALELLWQVSRPLIENDPPKVDGVRLTVFDLTPKRLRLEGEGKDLEAVEKYFQWLKNEPNLAGFSWKNPQPQLLGNGNARFVAEGTPPGISIQAEEGGEGESVNAP